MTAAAVARLATSTRPTVAEALLQQQAVAGIGNVYKSELLFLAGVHPFAAPADVSRAQWARLMRDARALLRANVVDPAETGVVSYRGMRRTTGRSNPAQRLYVYGRTGSALPPVRHRDPHAPPRRTQPIDVLVPVVPARVLLTPDGLDGRDGRPCPTPRTSRSPSSRLDVLLVLHCTECVYRECGRHGRT